jgi:hypothetical protein
MIYDTEIEIQAAVDTTNMPSRGKCTLLLEIDNRELQEFICLLL